MGCSNWPPKCQELLSKRRVVTWAIHCVHNLAPTWKFPTVLGLSMQPPSRSDALPWKCLLVFMCTQGLELFYSGAFDPETHARASARHLVHTQSFTPAIIHGLWVKTKGVKSSENGLVSSYFGLTHYFDSSQQGGSIRTCDLRWSLLKDLIDEDVHNVTKS